jgi:penicillin-binding protein 1A
MDKDVQRASTKALEDGLITYTKTRPYAGPLCNIYSHLKTDHDELEPNAPLKKTPGSSDETNAKNDMKMSAKILNGIDAQLPSTINKIVPVVVVEINGSSLVCKDRLRKTIKIQVPDKFYTSASFEEGDVILCRLLDDSRSYELYQQPEVTGGIAVMDLDNGDILGMSGGYSFDISPFNCVTQAQRQPGSLVKPFVYAAAIEEGWEEDDAIDDKPVSITLPSGERYSPGNYNRKHYGEIALRDGLIHSRNLATVNLALQIGLKPISNIFKKAGLIRDRIPISGVLGSIETTPLKLLSAFSAFFNKGVMLSPRFITSIEVGTTNVGKDGLCKDGLCQEKSRRIISEETAEVIKGMLHDVVRSGTAQSIAKLEEEFGIEIFGKTGTTNDFKDAWFIGSFSKGERRYLVCVFVGYRIPKSLGDRMSGSKVALPILANFVRLIFNK